MFNGVLNVYKEADFTSHDVVAKLRGILHQKKIGHTGTLDPAAVGVLPVCLGNATKLGEFLTEQDKEYLATLRLGITTDTQDLTGMVLSDKAVIISEEEVRAAVLSFQGSYQQIPPMYSALKMEGKKLYELARKGQEVERKARLVEIKELEIENLALPDIELRLVCSKGTYVRALCHDIGEKLACGGAMASLKRTRVGEFMIKDSLTLAQIEELARDGRIAEAVKAVDKFFEHLRAVTVKDEQLSLVKNGNKLSAQEDFAEGEVVRVYGEDGTFYAIYSYQQSTGELKPLKMFL
jgi:tRNA pseudouridine55 synthase